MPYKKGIARRAIDRLSEVRKTLAVLIVAASATGSQWLVSGQFSLDGELVTAALGVIAAAFVYFVPNIEQPGFASVRKALLPLGLAIPPFVVQYYATGDANGLQEIVTLAFGVFSAAAVALISNTGPGINSVGSRHRERDPETGRFIRTRRAAV